MRSKAHRLRRLFIVLSLCLCASVAQAYPLNGAGRVRSIWPGSRRTEADRARAIRRGLRFIYRTSLKRGNFAEYGSDYLWCFYSLGNAIKDEGARGMALRLGLERARLWRRQHRSLPRDADAGTIEDYAFGSDAADGLGLPDERLKEEIRRAAARFSARDYLQFDPLKEPPPTDVPEECEYDDTENARGSKVCRVCHRPLKMKSRYDVWYDALITVYSGDHYGIKLGAHYADVLKWLPSLRPYRGREQGGNPDFYESVYAVTHIVYTLDNYSQYRLSPKLLPQEFTFLRDNLLVAIEENDSDMLGEFMDSLRAFGLTDDDPLIRAGMEYYLSHQNRDGSWGDREEEDIYERYHPTWNAVAGLSDYAWRGERLSFPAVQPMLEGWARESQTGTLLNSLPGHGVYSFLSVENIVFTTETQSAQSLHRDLYDFLCASSVSSVSAVVNRLFHTFENEYTLSTGIHAVAFPRRDAKIILLAPHSPPRV